MLYRAIYLLETTEYLGKKYNFSIFFQIDQLQSKSKEERQLEKMIKKTGREIHKLRKAKLGPGELDKHMFQEKMAFLTTSIYQEVPPLLLNEDTLTSASVSSRSSTLKHAATLAPIDSLCSLRGMGPTGSSDASDGLDLDGRTDSSSSSTCSTPTPHLKPTEILSNDGCGSSENTATSSETDSNLVSLERFSYEIDPDIGVIV